MNERLRDALLRQGITPAGAAEELRVDPKTAERWITQGRIPYPRHRHALAALVRAPETYLWPDALSPERATQVAQSEIIEVYPRRAAIPDAMWQRMFDHTTSQLWVLVYAALFLPEQQAKLATMFKAKAQAGVDIQILLGDPSCRAVAQRGVDEGIGDAVASKIRNVASFYRPLRGVDGVKIRFHDTTLYNSIYRFDDEMLVNAHVYGLPAAHAPVLHLRRLSTGDFFNTYVDCFTRIFASADTAWPEESGTVGSWHESTTTTSRTRRSPMRSLSR